MSIPGVREIITQTVLSWEGVSAHPHRFGGTEYRIGKRELGHIHGDHLVEIPFPIRSRNEIVSAGLAKHHHTLPENGWVSCYIERQEDVQPVIKLLRRSYELARRQRARALPTTNVK